MKIIPLKQRDGSACGPTSIKMAADYFGLRLSYKKIETTSRYKKIGGMTNKGLVQTMGKLGFIVLEQSSAEWKDVIKANTPEHVIIVSWMMLGYIGHFSVVEKINKTHIYLADPHTGTITKIKKIEFMRLWMDYDDFWYPKKNTDIQLRWMAVVSKD